MKTQNTSIKPAEMTNEELEQAAGGNFLPNTYKKSAYHSVGISTNYHIIEDDEFRFMGKSITYKQANRIVEIAKSVEQTLNDGYRDNNKISRSEPAFIRAFNSQLKNEFDMTWDGSAGCDFEGNPFLISPIIA